MAENAVIKTEDELRQFMLELFEKISSGRDVWLTAEMEATFRKILESEDMVEFTPDLCKIVYDLFVLKELNTAYFIPGVTTVFSVDMVDKKLEAHKLVNTRQLDSNVIKLQTLRLKEVITNDLVFI